ncbi:MAG: hypothetical protein AAF456_22715 [Planctomycetota bacterium]
MRPIIALVLTVFLFAGVYGYTEFARRVRKPPIDFSAKLSSKDYSVEISRTFDCIGDPGWDEVKSLIVTFRGEEIISEIETVPADRPIVIEKLDGVLQRGNNIFVFANLRKADDFSSFSNDDWGASGDDFSDEEWAEDDSSSGIPAVAGAMRILVRQDETIVADETFWLQPGAMTIEESINFEAPVEVDQRHDH